MTLDQLMAFTVNPRPRASGAGVGGGAALLLQGALSDPAHADRRRGPRLRQARPVRRRSRPMRPPAVLSCATCSRSDDGGWLQDRRAARPAGRREARTRGRRRPRRRLEMDRRSPSTSPMATPMGCASSRASRSPLTRRGGGHARGPSGRVRAARRGLCRSRRTPRRGRSAAWRDRDGACRVRRAAGPIRSGRDRPRRRLRQHRRLRHARASSAAMSGRRTKPAVQEPETANRRRRGRRRGLLLWTERPGAARQPGDASDQAEEEEDDGLKPIPDRLMTELTAYRTLALRDALGENPDVAFLAALHALCLKLFYRYASDTCLDIEAKSVVFGAQAPGLNDTALAKAVDERHRKWAEQLPTEPADLWDALIGVRRGQPPDRCSRIASRSPSTRCTNPGAAGRTPSPTPTGSPRRSPSTWLPPAGRRRSTTSSAGSPRPASSRPCARQRASPPHNCIDHLKKGEMAERAQELLAGSGWLPEPLRTPGSAIAPASS